MVLMCRSWRRPKSRSTSSQTVTQMRTTTLRNRMKNWNTVFHLHWWVTGVHISWLWIHHFKRWGQVRFLTLGGGKSAADRSEKVQNRQRNSSSSVLSSCVTKSPYGKIDHTKCWPRWSNSNQDPTDNQTFLHILSLSSIPILCGLTMNFKNTYIPVSLGGGGYRECRAQRLCLPQKISDSDTHAGDRPILFCGKN